jgi:hypothetical protein
MTSRQKKEGENQAQTTEIYVDFNVCNMMLLLFFWPIKMYVQTEYVQLEEWVHCYCHVKYPTSHHVS